MEIHPPHGAIGSALESILFVEDQMAPTASERYKKALE